MAHGDIVITKLVDAAQGKQEQLRIMGATGTVNMVQTNVAPVDPLQIWDPWAKQIPRATQQAEAEAPLTDLQTKITDAVVERLQKGRDMEVDDDSMHNRVQALEQQMTELRTSQGALATSLQTYQVETTSQMQCMQGNFQQQYEKLEQVIATNTTQFQTQMCQHAQEHHATLETMMSKQMTQIETLINNSLEAAENKRARMSAPSER